MIRWCLASLLLLGLGYLVRQRKHDGMKQRWLDEEYQQSLKRGVDGVNWRWPVQR